MPVVAHAASAEKVVVSGPQFVSEYCETAVAVGIVNCFLVDILGKERVNRCGVCSQEMERGGTDGVLAATGTPYERNVFPLPCVPCRSWTHRFVGIEKGTVVDFGDQTCFSKVRRCSATTRPALLNGDACAGWLGMAGICGPLVFSGVVLCAQPAAELFYRGRGLEVVFGNPLSWFCVIRRNNWGRLPTEWARHGPHKSNGHSSDKHRDDGS